MKNYQGRSVEHMKFFARVLYQVYLNLVRSVLKKLKTSTHKAQFCTVLYVRLETKKKRPLKRRPTKVKKLSTQDFFFQSSWNPVYYAGLLLHI